MTFLAIGREVDRIACAFQRGLQLLAEIGFVFDDQDAQVLPLRLWFCIWLNCPCGR